MTKFKTQKKQNPPLEIIAHEMGVPEALIKLLQKKKLVSEDLSNISERENQLIIALGKMLGVEELIRLQWSRYSIAVRSKLVETADNYDLAGWERWLLGRYVNMYSETFKTGRMVVITKEANEQVLMQLEAYKKTKLTLWVRARAHELKNKARHKIATQKRKNQIELAG